MKKRKEITLISDFVYFFSIYIIITRHFYDNKGLEALFPFIIITFETLL